MGVRREKPNRVCDGALLKVTFVVGVEKSLGLDIVFGWTSLSPHYKYPDISLSLRQVLPFSSAPSRQRECSSWVRRFDQAACPKREAQTARAVPAETAEISLALAAVMVLAVVVEEDVVRGRRLNFGLAPGWDTLATSRSWELLRMVDCRLFMMCRAACKSSSFFCPDCRYTSRACSRLRFRWSASLSSEPQRVFSGTISW